MNQIELRNSSLVRTVLVGVVALIWPMLSACSESSHSESTATKVVPPFTFVDGVGYVPTEQVVRARATSEAGRVDCSTIRDSESSAACYEYQDSRAAEDDDEDFPEDREEPDDYVRGP